MAGITSKLGWVALGIQGAKGTPAAAPTVALKLNAAPSIGPVKARGRYNTTDTNRDQGEGYTSQMSVGGDFACYAHPQSIHTPLALAIGANAITGAGADKAHTTTPGDDLSWFTLWRMVGNQIREQFVDCKMGSCRIEGSAGNPVMCSFSMQGIRSTFLASDPAAVAALLATINNKGLLYPEGVGKLKIDTVAQPLTRVSIEVNNNISPFQADDYFLQDIDPGQREVTASFAMRFTGATAQPNYRTFFYGSDVGTTLDPAVGTHAFDWQWFRSATVALQVLLPQVTYSAVPVQPDPGGDPILVEIACEVEKPAAGNIISTITLNQTATL